ncbi:MAG: hypothetical protein KF688_03745 [Pirellulales bacterium]|nr:hypothetical protein [Pirellulales bacterium]
MPTATALADSGASTETVRLRLAWSSGAEPQLWRGDVRIEDGAFESALPLGSAPDEAVAVRLEAGALAIDPLVPRRRDACEATVRAGQQMKLVVNLRASADEPVAPVEITLGEALAGCKKPLPGGGELIVKRAPGDVLHVETPRESLVLWPSEELQLDVTPRTATIPAGAMLFARIVPSRGGETIWESSQEVKRGEPLRIAVPAPLHEGAYRVRLSIEQPPNLASRVNPFRKRPPLAGRDVEFAVVDPQARLPRLTNQWVEQAAIDLANPTWSQRLPTWVRGIGLPRVGAVVLDAHGRPSVKSVATGDLLELAPSAPDAEPTWLAVALKVDRPGLPHAIELELPSALRQSLAISIIEVDEAGRLTSTGRDSGAFTAEPLGLPEADFTTHRVEFWPRTKSPYLLLANKSPEDPLQLGAVRLMRRGVEPAPTSSGANGPANERVVAAYFADPGFVDAWGVDRARDPESGRLGETWATYLEAAQRMAQSIRAAGYNAAVIAISAEGASLAPVELSGGATAFDAGLDCGGGADPIRKDVLELLLRVFDREGLALIPAVRLDGVLPQAEELRRRDPTGAGASVVCLPPAGSVAELGKPPVYNLLDPMVQQAVRDAVGEIARRGAGRASFGGVALQLVGDGYGVLPGLEWGHDEATVARFAREMQLELPAAANAHAKDRSAWLLGPQRSAWTNWRNRQVASFYRSLVAEAPPGVHGVRAYLCLEDALSGPAAQQRLRSALAGKCSLLAAADEAGIELRALAEIEGAVLLRPQRLPAGNDLPSSSLDEFLAAASEIEDALAGAAGTGEALVYVPQSQPLPSVRLKLGEPAEGELVVHGPAVPLGARARAPLALALARRDCRAVFCGGRVWPRGSEPTLAAALSAVRGLPAVGSEVRLERKQPVTMRVYRHDGAITVLVVNDSPWSTRVSAPVVAPQPTAWRRLDLIDSSGPGDAQAAGTLPAGDSTWTVDAPAYGVVACRWESPQVRVGMLSIPADPLAQHTLRRRLAEVESRMSGLAQQRQYQVLANGGFEKASVDGAVADWEVRVGQQGNVSLDRSRTRTGAGSLHLVGADAIGVAAQSPSFAAPETGQLSLTAQVRSLNFHPQTKLYAAFEYQVAGQWLRRYEPVLVQSTGDEWASCELTVDDLPLDRAPVRVQFHLAGPGEAWIDDVELFDVRFSNSQRIDLAKRFFAAKLALDEGKIADCRRMLDSYWPRHLLAYVPATAPAALQPTDDVRIADQGQPAADGANAPPEPRRRKIAERVKEITPRLWR